MSLRGWPIRIHRVQTDSAEENNKSLSMPVFAVVITKLKPMPNMPQVRQIFCTICIRFSYPLIGIRLVIVKLVWILKIPSILRKMHIHVFVFAIFFIRC